MIIILNESPKPEIICALRGVFRRSLLIKEARALAISVHKGVRGGNMYDCWMCKKPFLVAVTQVDHWNPVIPLHLSAQEMSYDLIISRMWCPIDNLKVLCIPCHKEKTNIERAERARMKKIKDMLKELPSKVTFEQASNLFDSIPKEVSSKISGLRIGIITKLVVKWYLSLQEET